MRAGNGPDASQRRDLGDFPQRDRAQAVRAPADRAGPRPKEGKRPAAGAANLPRVAALPRNCRRTWACRSRIKAATLAGSALARKIGHAGLLQRAAGQRQTPLRQCLRQGEQQARQAIGAPCRLAGGIKLGRSCAAEHARRQRKLGALAVPRDRRRAQPRSGTARPRDRRHAHRSCRAGAASADRAASRGLAQGIGHRVAGAHRRLGRLQRVAPPLQADLAHHRLARDQMADAAELARECRQAPAGRRAPPAAPAGPPGSGRARRHGAEAATALGCRAAVHVSRDAPPPPWPA